MILLVGGTKGGSSRTTNATGLSVIRANAGFDVLLLDADRQASASLWASTRNSEGIEPTIPCVQKTGDNILPDIKDLSKRYQDIIIDAGGRDSTELRSAMLAANVVLVPVIPSQFDVWALEDTDEMIGAAKALNPGLQAIAVLNRVNPNPAIKEAVETGDFISGLEHIRLSEAIIRDRIAFRRAAMNGQSVVETKDNKAIAEIMAVYKEIFENGSQE